MCAVSNGPIIQRLTARCPSVCSGAAHGLLARGGTREANRSSLPHFGKDTANRLLGAIVGTRMGFPNRLLDSLASQAKAMAERIAELEQRQEDTRQQLDRLRALRSELLASADVLNRQRLR
jgi:hypothetical protein